jgi:hypothetical protein
MQIQCTLRAVRHSSVASHITAGDSTRPHRRDARAAVSSPQGIIIRYQISADTHVAVISSHICIALSSSHPVAYVAPTRTHASASHCSRALAPSAVCVIDARTRSITHQSHTAHMHLHFIIFIQSRSFVECASSSRADVCCAHSVAADRTYARCESNARRAHSPLASLRLIMRWIYLRIASACDGDADC